MYMFFYVFLLQAVEGVTDGDEDDDAAELDLAASRLQLASSHSGSLHS